MNNRFLSEEELRLSLPSDYNQVELMQWNGETRAFRIYFNDASPEVPGECYRVADAKNICWKYLPASYAERVRNYMEWVIEKLRAPTFGNPVRIRICGSEISFSGLATELQAWFDFVGLYVVVVQDGASQYDRVDEGYARYIANNYQQDDIVLLSYGYQDANQGSTVPAFKLLLRRLATKLIEKGIVPIPLPELNIKASSNKIRLFQTMAMSLAQELGIGGYDANPFIDYLGNRWEANNVQPTAAAYKAWAAQIGGYILSLGRFHPVSTDAAYTGYTLPAFTFQQGGMIRGAVQGGKEHLYFSPGTVAYLPLRIPANTDVLIRTLDETIVVNGSNQVRSGIIYGEAGPVNFGNSGGAAHYVEQVVFRAAAGERTIIIKGNYLMIEWIKFVSVNAPNAVGDPETFSNTELNDKRAAGTLTGLSLYNNSTTGGQQASKGIESWRPGSIIPKTATAAQKIQQMASTGDTFDSLHSSDMWFIDGKGIVMRDRNPAGSNNGQNWCRIYVQDGSVRVENI